MTSFNIKRLSISRKLTLLICCLLLIVIATFGYISFVGVKQASLKVGEERLNSLTEQMKTTLTGNVRDLISGVHIASTRPALVSFIRSGGKDSSAATEKILQSLKKDKSLYVSVQILNLEKLPVASATDPDFEPIPASIIMNELPVTASDFGKVGELQLINDSVYFPIIAPIADTNRLLGYLLRWRQLKVSPKVLDQITELMGEGAKFYVGNSDGSLWSDMIIPYNFLKQPVSNEISEHVAANGNPVMILVKSIPNSKWMVAVELSKKSILYTANNFLYWLLLTGGALLVIAIVITLLISRNITRPLQKLTVAVSNIADGNFSSKQISARQDELGQLSRAFAVMSGRVQFSKEQLRKKAEHYKLLFENNPVPIWVISRKTFRVLDMNQSALQHYGYTRQEFLQLKAIDLWPMENEKKYGDFLNKENPENKTVTRRHRKKDGSTMMVNVVIDNIIYNDEEARIILAHDVTERLKLESDLVKYRILQQELITETTIQAQEKEREEIARELHDNINQILASTKLYLELAKNGGTELLEQSVAKSYDNVNLVISEIRRLTQQLVPPAFDDPLVSVLHSMAEELEGATNISIEVCASNFNENGINSSFKLMVYRIVQEQLNNVIKHAAASKITISISNENNFMTLVISDNGKGFDTSVKSKGIGLRNIDNRVKFYKGAVAINSEMGKGCTLQVTIPLEEEAEGINDKKNNLSAIV